MKENPSSFQAIEVTNCHVLNSLFARQENLIEHIATGELEFLLEHMERVLPVKLDGNKLMMGEVEVPQPIAGRIVDHSLQFPLVNLWAENVGMGHLRIAQILKIYAQYFGLPVETISLGAGTRDFPALIERMAQAVLRLYEKESMRKAVENRMATNEVIPITSDNQDERNLELFFSAIFGPKEAKNRVASLVSGRSFAGVEETDQAMYRAFRIFKRQVRSIFAQHSANGERHLFLHPILARLWHIFCDGENKTVTVATDSAKLDCGWLTQNQHSLYVEQSQTYLGEFSAAASGVNCELVALGGFCAPPSALIAGKLAETRKDNLAKNAKMNILLTASGVAGTQQKVFMDIAQEAMQNDNTVIIQCGYGSTGEALYRFFQREFASQINQGSLVLHYSREITEAINFFTAFSFTEQPYALCVKGSEMCRIAVALGVPMILTGAVGDHEVGNVILACSQQKPNIFILPDVFENLQVQIRQLFPPKEAEDIIKIVEKRKCTSVPDAIVQSKKLILEGKESLSREINRGAALDLLAATVA
jgi:hypothetical protein